MKTVIVRIEGSVEPGDIIIVQASNLTYGGQSNARADVPYPRDRIEVVNGKKVVVSDEPKMGDVITKVVHEVNMHWGGGYTARRRNDNELVIQCMDGPSSHVRFYHQIEGSKKQTVTIEDLG